MKNMFNAASGWVVATFSLLALFLMGLSNSSTPASEMASEQDAYQISTVGLEPFIGEITMFGGNFAPRGWALCNGQLLPINDNQALFSLLGTTYGGDGRTTFALPDMRGRVVVHPGSGPGLSTYRLGEKGGTETLAFPEGVPAILDRAAKVKVNTSDASVSNLQPYVSVNYIIALQGIYPSRN